MTLLDHLHRHAIEHPTVPAIIHDGEVVTYAELSARVSLEAQRLRDEEHVQPGQLYQFVASQDVAYLVRFLALHEVGAICVPVDAIMADLPDYHNPAVSDILFTTGSTSKPKGVLLSQEAIMADAENLIQSQGFHFGLTFVICGPIHHFGSWSKVLPMIVVGGTIYLLEGLKDTEALFQALGSAPRTATFLVPSAIRMLMQLHRERLQSLVNNIEFIETGAAPIATSDMEQIRELLPQTRFYNTYASTETGIVCTFPFHKPAVCKQGCVGPTMVHAKIRLDAEGHIIVKGPMIMSGYLHDPQPPTEIVTSDIGQIDSDGNLYITGRDSEFINVGGLKVAPAEVEDVAMSMPGIADCLCVAAQHPLMGQIPRLLVVMEPGVEFNKKALIQYLKPRLEAFKIPLQYEVIPEVKKTFNGKKDRRADYRPIRERVLSATNITEFQRRVYLELLNVPRGETITYGQLAHRIGCGCAQAVGQALRKNPFAPEVPCHRVIASDGSMHGYNGQTSGEMIEKKMRLLREEGVAIP